MYEEDAEMLPEERKRIGGPSDKEVEEFTQRAFEDTGIDLRPRQATPMPHYPNWRYYCPTCRKFWESPLYHDNFIVDCPDCRPDKHESAQHELSNPI